MKKKLFFIYAPLIALSLFTNPLHAKKVNDSDVFIKREPYWNPFALLEDTMKMHSISNRSGLNLYEDEKHIVVEADLPGLSAEDTEVLFERGTLWVKGQKKVEEEQKDRNYYHRAAAKSFAYHVEIPSGVDESKAPLAEFKNGLMTVTFEKSEPSQPQKIEIIQR